jgi:phosphomethylpyrimidine synthase
MSKNGKENPYYENFNDLLSILHDFDVTISLGDGLRPGSLHDATDRAQISELSILGELVERCRAAGVQSIVEGPGHVPLHQVETNIRLQKALCNGAPFYVLGPLVTDVSPGYDHISGAIGGALAAMAGADFLCYLTPAEHLRLPSLEDVKEGVIASKIAAHAADIARGQPGAIEWDNKVSAAKARLDWAEMIRLCMDPEKAQSYRDSLPAVEKDLCSMCGKFCAMKRSNEFRKSVKACPQPSDKS